MIGLIFLAIVIVSPDGLMGLWDRIWEVGARRGGPPQADVEHAAAAGGGHLVVKEVESRQTTGVGSPWQCGRSDVADVQASRRREI